jgi:hypothetical protein
MSNAEFREKLLDVREAFFEDLHFFCTLLEEERIRAANHLMKYGDLRLRNPLGEPTNKVLGSSMIRYQRELRGILQSIREIDEIRGVRRSGKIRDIEEDY